MRKTLIVLFVVLIPIFSFSQNSNFESINFIIGDWAGTGSGFGNNKSTIESSFQLSMNEKYIEVVNESRFDPTDKNPEGEHHIDKGFISFDKQRKLIVYRQFNIEGYINQYLLNESKSNDSLLIFETETIENFLPGGKARWIITKTSENQIKTTFDVSFPNKEYSCFGENKLFKKQ